MNEELRHLKPAIRLFKTNYAIKTQSLQRNHKEADRLKAENIV